MTDLKSVQSITDIKELEAQFEEVILAINHAKYKAYKSVNKEIITLYWKIGEYISDKVKTNLWGKSVVKNLADYINKKHPHFKGYSQSNLWRMRQFYDTYSENIKLAPLVREISWTHNVIIFSSCKQPEESEFYLRLTIKEKLSKRELERQINTSSFERVMIADDGLSPAIKTIVKDKGDSLTPFKDTYIFDFLDDLPKQYKEKELQQALINGLKDFILELGKDFSFVGQNYKVEVGNSDFYIDLLFFHRELTCLVCFELKTEKFKPEHLGQLNFYLEALDQDVKKAHENPSIGILLCGEKDDEVVKYSLNRSLSPTVISDYKTKLIPKNILQEKLHELKDLFESQENN
jgi:predicted nuclease of restriction endonuclease-like (RecB) superfamily